MKIVPLLISLYLTIVSASINVADLNTNYVRLVGKDVEICDSGLSLKLTGSTVKAADIDFKDSDTECTEGSFKFEPGLPKNALFDPFKEVGDGNILSSDTNVTCTKKGTNYTLSALAVQPSKDVEFLSETIETKRVAFILYQSSGDPCVYIESSLGICFPPTGRVKLANGLTKTMNQLKLDDEVHVGGGRTSRVFMFTHAQADVPARFTKLTTESGNHVTLTPSHHLYVNGINMAARNVRVGDTLELADGSISAVVDVRAVAATGIYNPQTLHGDIIVDGIRVSTYTEAVYPRAAHALLAPFRLVYQYARATCSAFESGAPNFRKLFA